MSTRSVENEKEKSIEKKKKNVTLVIVSRKRESGGVACVVCMGDYDVIIFIPYII